MGPTRVFRWADTGDGHCQGLMASPEDVEWYGRVGAGEQVGVLSPTTIPLDALSIEFLGLG